jgi:methyltransferase
MNPLDAPHHLRFDEWHRYREGCVINRPAKEGKGSWVNIGLYKQECQVDIQLQESTRVTVRLDQDNFKQEAKYYTGKVVSQNEPF